MIKRQQGYYCKTKHDVDLMMKLLEKEGYKWRSGVPLRSQHQNPPIIYIIDSSGRKFGCNSVPIQTDIKQSIHVSMIQNQIISELRR